MSLLAAQLIPALTAGFIAYCLYRLSILLAHSRAGLFCGMGLVLERTPALDTFLTFVLRAVTILTVVIGCLRHVSNHGIITLDIIFFLSLLLLVLFRTTKESDHLPAKV